MRFRVNRFINLGEDNDFAVIRKIISQSFSENEVTVVEGDATVAERLLRLPFDHIFFTGSTQVGKKVIEAAARHLTSVSLELGGKSPTVIDSSADLVKAVDTITWMKFMNAGQTCIAPDYIFVHDQVADEVIARFRTAIQKLYGDGDAAMQSQLTRIINAKTKPLALYVWSRDMKFVENLIQNTSAGGTCVNQCGLQFLHANLPFGGVNHSGMGSYHGEWGIRAFSHERPVVKAHVHLSGVFFPPYTRFTRWVLQLIMRVL